MMVDSDRGKGASSGEIDLLDRISNLPDMILGDILSFLPTKASVATSILSQRWKFVWTHVPAIDVGVEVYYHAFSKGVHFHNFFNNFLLLNKVPCLRSCRLHVPYDTNLVCVNSWMEDIGKREVKEINLNSLGYLRSPFCVFTCDKLVVLTLRGGIYLEVPTSVCLPNLRVMNLISLFDLKGGSSLRLLTSSCPVLRELSIDSCQVSSSERRLHVCSPTLEKLHIKRILGVCDVVVIDAPNVEYLMLSDFSMSMHALSDLSSLSEADIDYLRFWRFFTSDSMPRTNILNLVRNFGSSLTTLRLRWSKFQCIQDFIHHHLPAFYNLTSLELEIWERCWCIVPAMLEHTPNLGNLIVACAPIESVMDCKYTHVIHAPRCLFFSIKLIEIQKFDGSEEAMETVSYLLMNAKVLNEIKIYCSPMLSLAEEMKRMLLSFPRGSCTCRVSICS